VVSDDVHVIGVVEHVQVAEVLRGVSLMLPANLHHFIYRVTRAIHSHSLRRIFDSVVFLVLAAIHFDEWCAVSPIEAGVLTGAKFVVLVYHVIHVLPEGVENHGKLSLHLFHVHQQAEERRNQVVLALVVQLISHFFLSFESELLFLFGWFHFVFRVFLVLITFLLSGILRGHSAVLGDTELLASALRQAGCFEHFFELVFELSAWPTGSSELSNQFLSRLLNGRVESAVLEFDGDVDRVEVVHIADDVFRGVLAFGDIGKHRGGLGLVPRELVVGEGPLRFSLRFIARLDLLARQFAPGALAYDLADVISDAESFLLVANDASVIDVEVEDVAALPSS